MTDVSGIPNMGFGGGGYFGGSGLANAYDSQAQVNNYNQQIANTLSQANAYNPFANSPGGFGGQTAAYAGAGAAYGRATGGFGTLPGGFPNTPAGYAAARAANSGGGGGGIGSDAVAAPDQPPVQQPMGSTFSQASYLSPTPMGPSQWTPAPVYSAANLARYQQYMTPDAIAAYKQGLANQSGYDNTDMFDRGGVNNLAANGGGRPAAPMAGDIGFGARPSYPNLGYNPGMQNYFANPGMNANQFQNRFGLGYPGAGTPSQYAPDAQMPPGFSQPYGADNPGGALPLSYWQTPRS